MTQAFNPFDLGPDPVVGLRPPLAPLRNSVGRYMNGTGEVRLFVAGPAEDDNGTGITMSNTEAVELATALFRHAAEARAAQVSEAGWIEALERELASARAWDERQAKKKKKAP